MINRILINREECEVRVAFLDNQNLVELHNERFDEHTIVNNIYRGRVQDVVPGLQAAFIDVGLERNLFLHFMDIRPESLVLGEDDQHEALRAAAEQSVPGRVQMRGRRPRQDPNSPQGSSPVKKGDEIIVQIVKDEIGSKAPRATTNLSLAGRYLVLLPFPSQEGGVSRKIAVGQDRFRLKKILGGLKTEDHSFIVRTAGLEQPEEAISKDAESLLKLWQTILTKYKRLNGPGLIHNDHDLLARLVRDAFPTDFEEVVCDDPVDAEEIRAQLREHMPGSEAKVRLYDGIDNIFDQFGAEKQVEKAATTKFWLKSGGYLIIDENEALTAIDVNTGRFIGKKDQEKTSLKTNLEACEAIAQQIRLRDIGGIIVCDFIDMLSKGHQDKVSEELKRHLKNDRAKTAVGKIGDFGLMVLTRKRQRMSLQNHLHEECPYCNGTGLVLCPDETFRRVKYQIKKIVHTEKNVGAIVLAAHPEFLENMAHRYRVFVEKLKSVNNINIVYQSDPSLHLNDYTLTPVRRQETKQALILPATRYTEPASRILSGMESGEFEPAAEEASTITELPAQPVAIVEEVTDAANGDQPKRRRRRRRRRRGGNREGADQSVAATSQSISGDEFDDDDDSDEPESDGDTALADEGSAEVIPIAPVATSAQAAAQLDADGKRRTRRGSRGGRNRRRQGEELTTPQPAATAASTPAASAPVTSPPPAELPKIRLTMVKKSPVTDIIGNVLDKVVGSLRSAAESATSLVPTETKQAEPEAKPAPATPKDRVSKEVENKEEPKKPTRRPRPARPKKAEDAKPAAEGKIVAEEKPKPATPSRRARSTAARKTSSVAAEPAEKKTAATENKPKAKPVKEKKSPAKKEEKEPAKKPARTAKKPTKKAKKEE